MRKFVKYCDVSECTLAEKMYVSHKNLNVAKDYEDGDLIRGFCSKQGDWCDCEADPKYCPYLNEFLN